MGEKMTAETVWNWKPEIKGWETMPVNGVVVRVEMLEGRFLLVYAYTVTDEAAQKFPELRWDEAKKLFPTAKIGEAMQIGMELADRYGAT